MGTVPAVGPPGRLKRLDNAPASGLRGRRCGGNPASAAVTRVGR